MNNKFSKLTILDMYFSNDGRKTICTITVRNNFTGCIQHFKGSAKCNPTDKFDANTGMHLSESRAKVAMYKWYKKFIDETMCSIFNKYLSLYQRERQHCNDIINNL